MEFDPYQKWLNIAADRRPPSPYDLLGLAEGEADKQRIHDAGSIRYERIRPYAASPDKEVAEHAHRIMAEITQAMVALSNGHAAAEEETQSDLVMATMVDEPFGPPPLGHDLHPAEPGTESVVEAEVATGPAAGPASAAPAETPTDETVPAEVVTPKRPAKPRGRPGLAIWAIDAGNCSLKAVRCRLAEETGRLAIDAVDRIEYPKLLNQPDAEPKQLLADALKQFASRHTFRGERIVISIPGRECLARFVTLPPVDVRKIPEIIEYEARKQIPFDLKDVVWCYQQMPGNQLIKGMVLEGEFGLFAAKRTAVFEVLKPFQEAGIPIDHVQLAPMGVYNLFVFDSLGGLPIDGDFDADDPPPSDVILSMGTDATDLIVTNRYRCWQRSIPLGGNHFTKALAKGRKLTFAKAEHLKRNATKAEDPKAIFQAMRPVFNDFLTEVQRSIGFYSSLNRNAKIGRLVGLGGPMRLPGLRKYLTQSLGYEFVALESLAEMADGENPRLREFSESPESFAVCCGLALDPLEQATVNVNLLPPELQKKRKLARAVRAAGRAAACSPRAADDLLRRMAGEENEIIHNFLRFLSLAALVAVAVLLWLRPWKQVPPAPPSKRPVAIAEKTTADVLAEVESLLNSSSEEGPPEESSMAEADSSTPSEPEETEAGFGSAASAATVPQPRPAGDIVCRFTGHSETVSSVAFSPGGKQVLTGSHDKTAILWDAVTGSLVRRFVGHTDLVFSVAVSSDGRQLLTGSADGTARLWNAASGLSVCQYSGHASAVSSVAFSPDGTRVMTGSYDAKAILWDAITGYETQQFVGHSRPVTSVFFSPAGTQVLTGSYDGTAILWNAVTGEPIRTLTGNSGFVYSVARSPDATYVLTGSDDRTAILWNAVTGERARTFTGHSDAVHSVAFSPDGSQLLTGSSDKTAILWDAATGEQICRLDGHDEPVTSVAFSPDGRFALTGSSDKTAILWRIGD